MTKEEAIKNLNTMVMATHIKDTPLGSLEDVRETCLMAIQALEQQPCPYWDYGLNTCRHANIGALATVDVLGKIRAEIEKAMSDAQEDSRITQDDIDCGICAGIQRALNIIDKYKDKGAEE